MHEWKKQLKDTPPTAISITYSIQTRMAASGAGWSFASRRFHREDESRHS